MKKITLILVLAICFTPTYSQSNATIDILFRNSYKVFELQRLPNGMYRDSKLFSGNDYHPISSANTGMGLIAICIADAMGWITNGQELALATLKTATGHTQGFTPDRTSNGYYRHFMDIDTGQQAWGSEYSTIDTDILVSGALFAMKYFNNDQITKYTLEMWNSIVFEAAISDAIGGGIYLSMNANGTGIPGSAGPYNEYMIAAWLAKNASQSPNDPGNVLWNNHYISPTLLPKVNYNSIPVLSDNDTRFMPSFTHQFNYYLCNYFTTSNDYMVYFKNAQQADLEWWNNQGGNTYQWGCGAGSAISSSYHADAINDNHDQIVSPHIIAGFIPVNPNSKNDLIALWDNNKGKYFLPNSTDPILWRHSVSNTTWVPNEIIGVDFSTMLFGIATLPEYLGTSFFSTNNAFFPLPTAPLSVPSFSYNTVKVYPNPFVNTFKLELEEMNENVSININDLTGKSVYNKTFSELKDLDIQLNISSGLYVIDVNQNGESKKFKVLKK